MSKHSPPLTKKIFSFFPKMGILHTFCMYIVSSKAQVKVTSSDMNF